MFKSSRFIVLNALNEGGKRWSFHGCNVHDEEDDDGVGWSARVRWAIKFGPGENKRRKKNRE
jgi:hypothetical protein